MESQVLSIEQMQELEELSINTSKASMFWYIDGKFKQLIPCSNQDTIGDWTNQYGENCIIPTFTLQDILEMLPKSINITYSLRIQCYSNIINFGYWKGEKAGWLKFCQDMNSTINSAFELLKWCKQNNYI